MTSKISFFKLANDERKKLSWLTAVQAVVFGMLIPFRVLLLMAERTASDYYQANPTALFEDYCAQIGLGHPGLLFCILIAGIVCALAAFSYLYAPEKLDFYHSLPIRREKLFAAKLAGSAMTFVIPYLICQILAVLLGMLYGVMRPALIVEMAAASLYGVLCFLGSYAGTLLAVMLTGKLLTSVLAVGVLGLYIPIIRLLAELYQSVFLTTMLEQYTSMNSLLKYSSPWALGLSGMGFLGGDRSMGLTGVWPKASDFALIFAVTLVLILVSVWLYRMRRSECAGSALAFAKTEPVVKLMLTIPAALVAVLVAYELFDNILWEMIFLLLFGTLACVIMEFIYRWDIRQTFCHKWHIAVTVLAAAAVFCCFRFDLTDYDHYLPAQENLRSMSMVPFASWCDMDFLYEIDGEPVKSSDDTSVMQLLDYLETDDVAALYEVAASGVANVDKDTYNNTNDPAWYVRIKYTTNSGKEIYRTYWVEKSICVNALEQLMQDPEYRRKYFPILSRDSDTLDQIFNCEYLLPSGVEEQETEDGNDENDEYYYVENYAAIPADKIADVIAAYQKDLLTLDVQDIMDADGELQISYQTEDYNYYSYETYPLGDQYVNTLAALKEIR
jgi:ABC-2 type transport system permease protein